MDPSASPPPFPSLPPSLRLPSAVLHGIEARRVAVDIEEGSDGGPLPIHGLGRDCAKETRARIRAALKSCGRDLPERPLAVHISPTLSARNAASLDLPIALGLVLAGDVRLPQALDGLLLVGELAFDGTLRPVRGILATAELARAEGLRGLVVPRACAAEAAVVDGLDVYAPEHLAEILAALDGSDELPRWQRPRTLPAPADPNCDFAELPVPTRVCRAVEIAVAGGHDLLLIGPPGLGKTMLARRIPTILPPMTREEQLDVTRIYSAVGLAMPPGLVASRPFRAPHHSVSPAALVGGGPSLSPGEASLAHGGVLFLDELPEFSHASVDSLLWPVREGSVRLYGNHTSVCLPAAFFLVASANPCACGWRGNRERTCTCGDATLARYRARLSRPMVDEIDVRVWVDTVPLSALRSPDPRESSATIRARVEAARTRQTERFGPGRLNAETSFAGAPACPLSAGATRALEILLDGQIAPAAGEIDRVLSIARTIADLADQDVIDTSAIEEAASLRAVDCDAPPTAS